jgi:hypothetical protein
MASEFALQIARRHCDTTVTVGSMRLAHNVDAELQEVRDVLFEVIREHDDPMSEYGCTTHTCQRARDLMEKLKP